MNNAIKSDKFKSMKRFHDMLCDVLQADMAAKSKLDRLNTRDRVVQYLKTLHEFALQGDWRKALPLTHMPDPIEINQLGGSELEMKCVLAVLKTRDDLLEKSKASRSLAVSGARLGRRGREGEAAGEARQEREAGLKGNASASAILHPLGCWRFGRCFSGGAICSMQSGHRGDGMIPGSAVHALHLFYRAQWHTSWGTFHPQLVRSTLQLQRGGAIMGPSHVSGDSVFPLPIPFLDAEFERTAQEVFPQRLGQLKEWKSLGVARLTNLLCSRLSFFHDGCPQGRRDFQLGGGGELNSAQQLAVRRLEGKPLGFPRLQVVVLPQWCVAEPGWQLLWLMQHVQLVPTVPEECPRSCP